MHNENYIPDGCTDEGYIKEDRGLHGALEFSYRPMLPEEQSGIANIIAKQDGKRAVRTQSEAIARKLISWGLTHEGKEIPITADAIRRLRPMLFSRLYLVVAGLRPSDARPGEGEDSDESDGEQTLDDIMEGTHEADAQAKNS